MLFLHQLGFSRKDFLVPSFHVLHPLLLLKLVRPLLDLVSLLVVLLLGQVRLDLSKVEELG